LLRHLIENSDCIGYLDRLSIVEEDKKNHPVSLLRYAYSWNCDGVFIWRISSEGNSTPI